MRKSRLTEEQIIKVLKEHASGLSADEVCRKHGISDATFYKWRSRYSGMERTCFVGLSRRPKNLGRSGSYREFGSACCSCLGSSCRGTL
jgi:putative transposase